MLSQQQNDEITRVGPGAPAGDLMRRYWQPIALAEELSGPRPIKRAQLLGEHIVVFRDENGCYGALDCACPHRGADLSFGRLEDGGLRCSFHGWLFDVNGRCLQTPAEPEDSTLAAKIHQRAYPVCEKSGILFAYLGAGEPPAFPSFDCFVAPDAYTFAFKGLIDCNWLQALEVGIDPAHASFLHRFFNDDDPSRGYGQQFRGQSADSAMPMTKVLREYPRPHIEVELTDFGLRIVSLRRISDRHTHVRVTNQIFPHGIVIPMSEEMTITQWHVPVNDVQCYWYAIFTSFGAPVDKETMRRQRLELYTLPDYAPRKNRANDYGFDPHEQESETYTGMGHDINVHDQWAVESMGSIQDRTKEHLGRSDRAITAYRRLLRQAIHATAQGGAIPLALDAATADTMRGPVAVDGIGPTEAWDAYWRDTDRKRRESSPWASRLP